MWPANAEAFSPPGAYEIALDIAPSGESLSRDVSRPCDRIPRLALRALLLSLLAFGPAPAAASDLDDFARCLARAGTRYYTAAWCPHCAQQERLFGSAVRYLRSVDCTGGCTRVHSFPTWEFASGQRFSGVAPLGVLASRTGCRLGEARPATAGRDASETRSWSATRDRYVGGARIIEVPRR